ncbi:hypothetical protein [Thalassobaculum sp.]|jgi:hypothetical protein|uniref:hypothetical protein n=1 Tax=Thalassobaculum sp. TaxID=2022740 RepID=UPI003B5AAEE8
MRIASVLLLTSSLLWGCSWRDAGIDPVRWLGNVAEAACEAARNCSADRDGDRPR